MSRNNEPGTPHTKGQKSQGHRSAYVRKNATTAVRWEDVNGDLLVGMLDALQSVGDAALLGATMDGGALVICVCSGDDRIKYYPSSVEEATQTIGEITNAAHGLARG